MDRIQVLPDLVINQIAAGEVVERPASVVKELVENSLDAGATDIRIELEDGGRKRITIVDNGSGMNPRDAERALLRHATSKIHSLEDLFSARSLGFRGEALASIAAVSKFSLTTCEQGASVGVRHTLTGGEEKSSQSLSAQGGTSVTVAELFFNIPARKSFLKGAATEFGYCMELIQAMALSRPDVRFVLVHNGKEQLAAPAVAGAGQQGGPTPAGESTLRARAAMIFGEKTASSLVYMHKTSPHGSVEGLVSPPGVERPNGRDMFTFVNGRWVREKTLKYAVLRGYHSHMMRGKYPVVIINVTLDPSLVDVNVHPAKTEVRFQYASELQGLVAIGIREAMRQGAWAAPSPVDVSAPGEAEKATHEISSLSSSSSSSSSRYQRFCRRRLVARG